MASEDRQMQIEDNQNDGNKVDKGYTEAAENRGRETPALRAIAGSLHRPLAGILITFRTSCLRSELEDRGVTVLSL